MPLLSRSCIAAVLVFVVAGLGMTPSTSEAQTNFRTRSVVMARNGIVATSQPLAAQAGLDVLKARRQRGRRGHRRQRHARRRSSR